MIFVRTGAQNRPCNDPDALAGSANTYLIEFAAGLINPETNYEAKVLGQADRAIALDHNNVWAYYVKSIYLTYSRRPSAGLDSADAGLAVDPNFARLYVARAAAENSLGRFEEAKSNVQQVARKSWHCRTWHAALRGCNRRRASGDRRRFSYLHALFSSGRRLCA